MKPGPQKGYRQSREHVARKSKAQTGEGNGRYKDGRRSYRRIAKASPGDVVHHKDGNRRNNSKSNLRVLSDSPKKGTRLVGRRTTPSHERAERRASK